MTGRALLRGGKMLLRRTRWDPRIFQRKGTICLVSSTTGRVLLYALASLTFQRAYEVGIIVTFIYWMRKRGLRRTEATRGMTGRLPPHRHASFRLVSQHMFLSPRWLYRPTSLQPTQSPQSGTSLDQPARLHQIPNMSNSVRLVWNSTVC